MSLLGMGCQAVLDVDGYSFDGVGQTPGLPLKPDGGSVTTPVLDAGSSNGAPDAGTTLPPVVVPPGEQPRPVVVDAPDPLFGLAGSGTGGGPRTASCEGGVIDGIVFRYWTSMVDPGVPPDVASYIWPLCRTLAPTTPSLTSSGGGDPVWLTSEPTDPFFVALRENESADALVCPEGQYLIGIEGTYDEAVGPSVGFRSFGIRCAGLGSNVERSEIVHSAVSVDGASIAPAPGAVSFAQQCPDGRVGNQLNLRFGVWLDSVSLGCSVVRWPFTAGHTCATPRECQSGSCGADGLCALQ